MSTSCTQNVGWTRSQCDALGLSRRPAPIRRSRSSSVELWCAIVATNLPVEQASWPLSDRRLSSAVAISTRRSKCKVQTPARRGAHGRRTPPGVYVAARWECLR